jgi:RNA polymerase sigma-70 factor (ECF subfamily)
VLHGAEAVAAQARRFAPLGQYGRHVMVNGGPGVIVAPNGQPVALLAVTVSGDRITEIDIIADVERLARLNLTELLAD